jgi:ParB family chromosome partitioning protein
MTPGAVFSVSTFDIKPGKFQPRYRFDDDKLTTLIDSIREKGIIQPLVVRPLEGATPGLGNRTYEIIAGERRWRAARMLNLETVPVVIRDYSDREALEVALIENIQRDDLTPIEEAEGYHRLMEEFSYTQEELARSIGKSRSHVANMLRLNQLPGHIKDMIHDGKISAGHARTLVNAENVEELAQNIIENNLNVRQAEHLKKRRKQGYQLEIPDSEFIQQTKIIENEIAHLLRLPVSLKVKQSGATLVVNFNSYEAIDELMDRLRTLPV